MSRRVLLIDVGNSRVKWAFEEEGVLGPPVTVGAEDAPVPARAPGVVEIGLCATGSAQRVDSLVAGLARHYPKVPVRRASAEARHGRLVNSYDEPLRMGADRWLAMVAAWQAHGAACCVLDAGTALTIDVIADDGAHRGGWICPGLALMRDVLARSTARVGGDLERTSEVWGRSTGQAVAAGTEQALIATAAAGVDRFLALHPGGHVFLTGGDAELIAPAVTSRTRSATIDPTLVLRGLSRWLEGGRS